MQATTYNIERSDWTIDKASDQRMVYVPKDTVVEFMRKVSKAQSKNFRLDKLKSYGLKV